MKKYLAYTTVLFLLACNSNDEQSSKKVEETGIAKKDSIESAAGKYSFVSGKFEITGYKKDTLKIKTPKIIVEFTQKGEVIKQDGNSYFYRIEGDSIAFMSSPTQVTHKAGIEFLTEDKSSFIVKTPLDKTEITYKKVQ